MTGSELRIIDRSPEKETRVNGVCAHEAFLVGGEIIRVGQTALVVRRKSAYETAPSEVRAFGRVIGEFQALQHRAAAILGELEMTRSAVEAALAALDAGDPDAPRLASLAKASAGETFRLAANEMIQMHGGIGMTEEHDAGLYLKRARAAEAAFGGAAFHRERWGRLSGF